MAEAVWLQAERCFCPLEFYYDDNSNRVRMTTKAGDIYYFVYDPTASVPAVVAEICTTQPRQYLNIREPDGSLVSRETYNNDGERTMSRTFHFDGLGSTVALTDETGAVTDKYTYDEWGKLLSHTDATGGQQDLTTDNPYQYVGQLGYYTHYQEPDFGLLQLGVRYYDSTFGRFTQKDPANDGINWYAYVGNGPTVFVDPSGLSRFGGHLRGQLMFGPSCKGAENFVRYTPENKSGLFKPKIKSDNWYAVDAIHVYCGGSWTTIKIPDGAMCRVTCKEVPCGSGRKQIEMHIDCSRGLIAGKAGRNFEVDPLDSAGNYVFPPPTFTPATPKCACGVTCKQTGVPGWTP